MTKPLELFLMLIVLSLVIAGVTLLIIYTNIPREAAIAIGAGIIIFLGFKFAKRK